MYCKYSGKKCYTQKEAGDIIRDFKRHDRNKRFMEHIPQRAYFCKECKAFHLTHFRKKDRALRTKNKRKY